MRLIRVAATFIAAGVMVGTTATTAIATHIPPGSEPNPPGGVHKCTHRGGEVVTDKDSGVVYCITPDGRSIVITP